MSPLIRGDLAPEVCEKYHFNPLDDRFQLSVFDINTLRDKAQKFVVGVLLNTLYQQREKD